MSELRFFGHSDNLVCVSGNLTDEIQAIDHHVRFTVGYPEASAGEPSRGIVVALAYAPDGVEVWCATVSQIDEGVLCPWEVRFETVPDTSQPGRPYSVTVVVKCPAGTPVIVDRRRSEENSPWERHGAWGEAGKWSGA